MTTERNNRNDWFNPNDENSSNSFKEHNEQMRVFRKSHASNLKARATIYLRGCRATMLLLTSSGKQGGQQVSSAW